MYQVKFYQSEFLVEVALYILLEQSSSVSSVFCNPVLDILVVDFLVIFN